MGPRSLLCLVPGLVLAGLLPGQEPGLPPLPDVMPERSARIVHYRIRARLDDDRRTIRAEETVSWRNPATGPATELLWHVYNNAWAGPGSLWLQEARLHGNQALPKAWGRTEIGGIHLGGPEGPALEWAWVPQAGAPEDRTVLRLELPAPVPPGEEVTVHLDFTTVLPPAFRRSGVGSGGYVHAVQWYPKLGVFEDRPEGPVWNCEPYHFLTEFYADFGVFDVELDLPAEYAGKVAASGSLVGEPEEVGGRLRLHFLAEDVHDFAWTGDPDFLRVEREFQVEGLPFRDPAEEQRVAAALGRTVAAVLPRPTRIILMLQPEHEEYRERYLEATARALYWFGLWYGSYPYETISVIDPANDARATGGMEYPRLITGGVRQGRSSRTLSPEGVTVHEFGHQFWYGLVGNDEFRHAWLDEGFNTFSTNRVLTRAWPPELAHYQVLGRDLPGRGLLPLPSFGPGDWRATLTLQGLELPWPGGGRRYLPLRRRTGLETFLTELAPASHLPRVPSSRVMAERDILVNAFSDPLERPTWQLLEHRMRRVNAYYRPALTLETMSRLMGEPRWTRLMRAWSERWRFRHPRPDDFFAVVKEFGTGAVVGSGADAVPISWPDFWKQAYHENQDLDHALHRLVNLPAGGGEDRWDVIVEVRRHGGFRVPVELEVEWADGSRTRRTWDGQDWWWRWRIDGSSQRAVAAVVDPDQRLLLDRNWLNNSRRLEPDRARACNLALRVLLWAQQVLHWYGGMG